VPPTGALLVNLRENIRSLHSRRASGENLLRYWQQLSIRSGRRRASDNGHTTPRKCAERRRRLSWLRRVACRSGSYNPGVLTSPRRTRCSPGSNRIQTHVFARASRIPCRGSSAAEPRSQNRQAAQNATRVFVRLCGRGSKRVSATERDTGQFRKPLIFCVCGIRTIMAALYVSETLNIPGPAPESNDPQTAR
jgi:hypothetical protein